MKYASFAFDIGATTRTKDENGYLHVGLNNLTRAQVRPYLGKEVAADDLGWDAEKVYNLLCPHDELKKSEARYNGLPLLMGHHEADSSNLPKDKIIGTTGTNAKLVGDFLQNSVTIWDAEAIEAIESGEISELSCGYSYTLKPESGDGYDGVMTDIRPGHVALVERGRAGAEVRVGDGDLPGHAGHGNQYVGGEGGGAKVARKKKSMPEEEVKVLGDIAKRKGVSPKSGVAKYGKVRFADPKNKKYPLDTPAHVRAALSYWGMPKNRRKYSPEDQKTIGGRIRSAAKKFKIGSTTGDAAGFFKETAMRKKDLSPLAHKVAGVVHTHLRTKLAADAAIKPSDLLALVHNISSKRFGKQAPGIAGAVKDKFGLDSSEELLKLLLAVANDEDGEGEDEDEEALEDEDGEDKDEEALEDEDGEGEDADEPEAEKKAEKKMAQKVLGKKEAEKAFKKAGDALRAEFKALREAERAVRPLVGDVEGFDTAEQVYRYALDKAGVKADGVHPSALPTLVAMASKSTTAHDAQPVSAADTAATLERFPGLKGLKRTLV